MDQVIIRVDKKDYDIRDCKELDRMEYYHSLSKGQIVALLELYVKDQFGQM